MNLRMIHFLTIAIYVGYPNLGINIVKASEKVFKSNYAENTNIESRRIKDLYPQRKLEVEGGIDTSIIVSDIQYEIGGHGSLARCVKITGGYSIQEPFRAALNHIRPKFIDETLFKEVGCGIYSCYDHLFEHAFIRISKSYEWIDKQLGMNSLTYSSGVKLKPYDDRSDLKYPICEVVVEMYREWTDIKSVEDIKKIPSKALLYTGQIHDVEFSVDLSKLKVDYVQPSKTESSQ